MSYYVGVDVGDSRIGLSISDQGKKIALSLGIIERENKSYCFKKIKNLLNSRDVEVFIVGLPLRTDGRLGERGEEIQKYADGLRNYFNKEVLMWDERYTTVIAEKTLHLDKKKIKKKRKIIDGIAAQIILQSYLDHLNK